MVASFDLDADMMKLRWRIPRITSSLLDFRARLMNVGRSNDDADANADPVVASSAAMMMKISVMK